MKADDETPSLDEFLRESEADSNLWWRIGCGHHLNLFEAALDERDAARAENAKYHDAAMRISGALVDHPSAPVVPIDDLEILRAAEKVLRGEVE